MPTPRSSAARAQIAAVDPIWATLREEADAVVRAEPALGGFVHATVLAHDRLEESVCHPCI